MKQILRYSIGLAALLAGCHREFDVPECAHDAMGCVEQETGTDAAAPVDDTGVVIDGEPDETLSDGADTSAGDVGDVSTDSSDGGFDTTDVGGDACAMMTCTTPPPATCASTTTARLYAATGTCSAGACSYAPVDTACPPGEICTGGVCSPRSCAGGLSCGGVGCCEAKLILGGTVAMGRAASGPENDVCSTWASPVCDASEQPEHSATVSAFRLDTFEVTVGRFRKFVAAYPASKPAAGAGAHPSIAASGWQAAWNSILPLSAADLVTAIKCDALQTWTDSLGANENKPINCVDWYTAFAFCAWDGGRLPTEAEWEYAAAAGADNRVLPWGNTAPSIALAIHDCLFDGVTGCAAADLPAVGSAPSGAARWGQQDLAGSVAEWNLDWYAGYTPASVTNYANVTSGTYRVIRGGGFRDKAGRIRAASRGNADPTLRAAFSGIRCARP